MRLRHELQKRFSYLWLCGSSHIQTMIGIVGFSMVIAPLSHVLRYVVGMVLLPFARSGVSVCFFVLFVALFAGLLWCRGIRMCMPRSTTRLAIGCQSIWAVLIFAEFSKVGFSAGGAFLRSHGSMLYHTCITITICLSVIGYAITFTSEKHQSVFIINEDFYVCA
jgi:hypothetical protein